MSLSYDVGPRSNPGQCTMVRELFFTNLFVLAFLKDLHSSAFPNIFKLLSSQQISGKFVNRRTCHFSLVFMFLPCWTWFLVACYLWRDLDFSTHSGLEEEWQEREILWTNGKVAHQRGPSEGQSIHYVLCSSQVVMRQYWWYNHDMQLFLGVDPGSTPDQCTRQWFWCIFTTLLLRPILKKATAFPGFLKDIGEFQ